MTLPPLSDETYSNLPQTGQKQDVFPSLNEDVQRRVQKGLRELFREAAPKIEPESWEKLKPILAKFKRDAEYLRGFVNKGEVAKLRKISERAQKLLTAIKDADKAGLSVIVTDALKESPSDDEQHTLEDFQGALETLVETLMIEPRDEPFLKDTSREYLVEWFGYWWRSSTGQEPDIQEGIKGDPPPTAFMYVANEVFNLPGMPHPTGVSYKSLKDQFRNIRNRKAKLDRLGDHLSKLSTSQSNDT